jgi:hypothetical protein
LLVTKSRWVSPGGEQREVGCEIPEAMRSVVMPSPWPMAGETSEAHRRRARGRIMVRAN